jgi:antitoxin (DNA-binding transcriptional repressor) of toxin-antitoxin stability system
MDIDVSQLPAQAAEAVMVRHEQVRVLRDGKPVATVVPTPVPVFRSHKALRDRIGPLGTTFAEELRAERDLG